MERYLKNAIDYANGTVNRQRLTTVKAAIESLGLATPSAAVVLKLMDDNFGAGRKFVKRAKCAKATYYSKTIKSKRFF